MEPDLRNYLSRTQYGESDPLTFPTIFAHAVKYLSSGIQVVSNKKIGSFNTFDGEKIEHENCYLSNSNSQRGEGQQKVEYVAKVVGDEAVRFLYNYRQPMFKQSQGGQIRVSLSDDNYLKKFDSDGTFAFRFDSVLSHLCMMHGAYHDLPYGLKPGQLLPARHTDETVGAGTYFYGSLKSCRQAGDGHWILLDERVDEQTKKFLNLGVITVLKVTNVIAGPPNSKNKSQWAKCGSSPTNAFVIGSIVTQSQIKAFNAMIDKTDVEKIKSFMYGISDILHSPSAYLSPESAAFLYRYVAGGVFLAHADWIPLRCVTAAKFDPGKTDSWITEYVIQKYIVKYIRDESFSDTANQSVVNALRDWIFQGLSKKKVIRDPSTLKCYTIREVAKIKADNKFFQELEMAPCKLRNDYLSAMKTATEKQHSSRNSAKRRKLNDEREVIMWKPEIKLHYPDDPKDLDIVQEPETFKAYDSIQQRSKKNDPAPELSTAALEPLSTDSGHNDKYFDSVAHFLAKHTAGAIYDFLDGQYTQLAKGLFMKKRRPTMVNFLEKKLKSNPSSDWETLVTSVTDHIIHHRLSWGLRHKTSRKWLHPFCENNLAGQKIADELADHISNSATWIVHNVFMIQSGITKSK